MTEPTSTLRALAAPRRAVPLGLVLATLAGSEWWASGSWRAVLIDVAFFAVFCLVAPASWRAAAARARARPSTAWVAYAAFTLVGAAVVVIAAMVPNAVGLEATYVVDPPATGLLLVLFWVGGWGLGRDIDLEAGIVRAERRAASLALDAERARLVAMRAQLDPHFLFNTLNAIAEWCREDPLRAEAATLKLAAMLRTILDASARAHWPLAREVALMGQLLELHAVRDAERHRFRLDVPEALPEVEVPPMLFLPLVENAITHGPGAGHAGEVRVRVAIDDAVALTVDNPGRYRGRREGGQGLAMVERRIALAYGSGATLTIEAAGERTLTALTLPRTIDREEAP